MIYKKLAMAAITPMRAHHDDAGVDLCSLEKYTLVENTRVLVSTGIGVEIPTGFVGLLLPRSSLSKKNIIMLNSVGIIDAGYRGPISAALCYIGNFDSAIIEEGERILQLVLVPCLLSPPLESNKTIEQWNTTERGFGGFGSTG